MAGWIHSNYEVASPTEPGTPDRFSAKQGRRKKKEGDQKRRIDPAEELLHSAEGEPRSQHFSRMKCVIPASRTLGTLVPSKSPSPGGTEATAGLSRWEERRVASFG